MKFNIKFLNKTEIFFLYKYIYLLYKKIQSNSSYFEEYQKKNNTKKIFEKNLNYTENFTQFYNDWKNDNVKTSKKEKQAINIFYKITKQKNFESWEEALKKLSYSKKMLSDVNNFFNIKDSEKILKKITFYIAPCGTPVIWKKKPYGFTSATFNNSIFVLLPQIPKNFPQKNLENLLLQLFWHEFIHNCIYTKKNMQQNLEEAKKRMHKKTWIKYKTFMNEVAARILISPQPFKFGLLFPNLNLKKEDEKIDKKIEKFCFKEAEKTPYKEIEEIKPPLLKIAYELMLEVEKNKIKKFNKQFVEMIEKKFKKYIRLSKKK